MPEDSHSSANQGVHESHLPWKLIAAGTAGNVMEWYDFAVYGYFAATIGDLFFPADNPTTSLIAAFGVFAAGFLMRPLGAIVFGTIGDHVARKTALTISVFAMAIPTFIIGLLPTYAQAGVFAPIALVVLRLIQGLSVGGEFTTSIVFLVESSGRRHRGFAGSWSGFGATAGILLGSGVGAIITSVLSDEAVHTWGWRLPFLLGIGVGVAGLFARRHLPEPPAPPKNEQVHASLFVTFREHWQTILHIAFCCVASGVGYYVVFVYLVTYMQQVGGLSEAKALGINTLNMALVLTMLPVAGWLSDRIGRKPLLLCAAAGMILFSWPLLWLVHHHSVRCNFFGQLGFTVLIAMMSVVPVMMVEASPRAVRCTVIALGYNLAVGLLGGTAPMMATWLISRTGNDLSPAFYMMGMATLSLIAILRLGETRHSELFA
ncbi:MAG: MFS transporter [Planctomycetota bacterium]